jgi:hypothetical protein
MELPDIMKGVSDGSLTLDEALNRLSELQARPKWRQVWPPVAVWCEQNGGHCPGRDGLCKHCGTTGGKAA